MRVTIIENLQVPLAVITQTDVFHSAMHYSLASLMLGFFRATDPTIYTKVMGEKELSAMAGAFRRLIDGKIDRFLSHSREGDFVLEASRDRVNNGVDFVLIHAKGHQRLCLLTVIDQTYHQESS